MGIDMKYFELLELLKKYNQEVEKLDPATAKISKALYEVVLLHTSINAQEAKCVACAMNTYDCPTREAIQNALCSWE